MLCCVYKSLKKDDTYVFLAKDKDFEELPDSLKAVFGRHELVMELELTPDRKLARTDASQVMQDIEQQGFHLQLPPKDWLEV